MLFKELARIIDITISNQAKCLKQICAQTDKLQQNQALNKSELKQ
jgi:hypothetical protein